MFSLNNTRALWLYGFCRGIKEHKKKISLAVLLCCSFILLRFIKANAVSQAGRPTAFNGTKKQSALSQTEAPAARENENLEEELNDLDSWELDYFGNKPSTNVEVSIA